MKKEHTLEYLSDQELEQLIAAVEQEELIPAPPELMEQILGKVETKKVTSVQERPSEKRIEEFRRYCFRVVTSVAAAVLIVFTVPSFLDTVSRETENRQKIEISQIYPSKEEVLGKQGLLESALRNKMLFGDKNWNWLSGN